MRWFRVAVERLRQDWLQIVAVTLAATLAWVLAADLFKQQRPFFAPAAVLIVLNQARGQRLRRAAEIVVGVAAGVLVADLVIPALGHRSAWAIFVVIVVTISLGVALGAGSTTMVQGTVSALYLVVIPPPTHSLVPTRFVDALLGGTVALVLSQVLAARAPLDPLISEARRAFDELADALAQIVEAVQRRDESAAYAALERARGLDVDVQRLRTAVRAAAESLRLDVRRRRHLDQVRAVEASSQHVDYAVRNVRMLARVGVTLTRLPMAAPPDLIAAVRHLGDAARAAGHALAASITDHGRTVDRYADQARESALDAVRTAGRLSGDSPPLPVVMIVGQVRATAIDLLRGAGAENKGVLDAIDEAVGLPRA
ncbi:FUSC family protein [Micromonospora polyrhachis]|uniref:Uncharacterized membrane protein YgaE (UPF0421/DUF939 family) n=1 Tax=Micromonospora polyrhachis TaxID=1282883 RepID=A0A7W7SNB8_9ACTN|nr:FUSC family protein [Micromonospora polyrhachis]MBB4957939.1 uncharacterized membrane protein YgaE (UPF0421/DUF939 family) [Micromonospora polyrhachis]